MKTNLRSRVVGALALATLIPLSLLLAVPRQATATDNPEPRRIYDIASGNFIDNPDYRELAKHVVKSNEQTTEPRRVNNPVTEQLEANSDYRTPGSLHVPDRQTRSITTRRHSLSSTGTT